MATPREVKIEATENTIGRTERKIKIKRIITASMDTVAIIEISRLAELELSWLWNGVPENTKVVSPASADSPTASSHAL